MFFKMLTAKQAVRFARDLQKRKHRHDTKHFFIEGINFVEDALLNRAEIRYLLVSDKLCQKEKGKGVMELAQSRGVPFFCVQENALARLADTETPQGILAVCKMPVWDEEQVIQGQDALLVALDGVQDPGNLGTMIRTGAGIGVNGFFLGEGTVDLYNSKVLRSTMGTTFQVPAFHRVQLIPFIKRLKSMGFKTVAADPRAEIKHYGADFRKGPLVVIIGNESRGISPELLKAVDLRVSIPLAEGVESLNAAVAAALVLYEIFRQRDTQTVQ
ncbi:MAG TPA: RNA methyltransferase [Peptococcaceae bacterium]|nr:RNA methyltransferase [Peptococcaceae bacterium]